MAKEITMNEEVMETVEEVATVGAGKGLKIAGGVTLAALVGFIAYKVGKKITAKIKDKKAQKAMAQCADAEIDDAEAND